MQFVSLYKLIFYLFSWNTSSMRADFLLMLISNEQVPKRYQMNTDWIEKSPLLGRSYHQNICKISLLLTSPTVTTQVNTQITSCLDYCKILLTGYVRLLH